MYRSIRRRHRTRKLKQKVVPLRTSSFLCLQSLPRSFLLRHWCIILASERPTTIFRHTATLISFGGCYSRTSMFRSLPSRSPTLYKRAKSDNPPIFSFPRCLAPKRTGTRTRMSLVPSSAHCVPKTPFSDFVRQKTWVARTRAKASLKTRM